jgi:phage baseplate assembly protein V
MSAEIGELQRRMANMFRVGKIAEVNRTTGRVKVTFQGVTSAWLPWMTSRAGAVKDWNPPSVGEQVCVCSPSGELEAGFIMPGSINYDGNPAPDTRANVQKITLPSGGSYEISVGGMTLTLAGGKLTLNGSIEVTGDVKAGAISLKDHKHGGIVIGSDDTGVPK